jgi:hypothetical protein
VADYRSGPHSRGTMLDDMRRDRDAWRDQAQARVLPAPGAKMSWRRWSRITG